MQSVAGLKEMPTFLVARRQDLALRQLSFGEAFIAWAVSMLLTPSSLLRKSAVGLGLQAPMGSPSTLRPYAGPAQRSGPIHVSERAGFRVQHVCPFVC